MWQTTKIINDYNKNSQHWLREHFLRFSSKHFAYVNIFNLHKFYEIVYYMYIICNNILILSFFNS